VINTETSLAAFLPTVRSAAWVAVDTEADSLHAYPEKLCLLQISTAAGDELVDPLAGMNIDPLLDALAGHELIFHAADYDLRLLRKHHEFVPGAIFDTMLAARLLGMKKFSLGDLVETGLGVKLEKGSQKADWARRPLTPKMEDYARNDTRYLKPLADRQRPARVASGKLRPAHCRFLAAPRRRSRRRLAREGQPFSEPRGARRFARTLAVARDRGHRRQQAAVLYPQPRDDGDNRGCRRRATIR
jgi:ribonuclease D